MGADPWSAILPTGITYAYQVFTTFLPLAAVVAALIVVPGLLGRLFGAFRSKGGDD